MNCPHFPPRPKSADESLWLVVGRDKRAQCFELRANIHKAIVVGSSRDADVQIPGAPPVAFFLERDGHGIWLIPAYSESELRIDAKQVYAQTRIFRRAIVEFSDARLELELRDTPPTLRTDSLRPGDGNISDPVSVASCLRPNNETATTIIAQSTVLAAMRQSVTKSLAPQKPVSPLALPTKTIEMGPIDFDAPFDDTTVRISANPSSTQPLEPEALPLIPAAIIDPSDTPFSDLLDHSVATPPTTQIAERPSNVKTRELGPIGSSHVHNRGKFETLRQTVSIQITPDKKASDTTDFEVPMLGSPTIFGPTGAHLPENSSSPIGATNAPKFRAFLPITTVLARLGEMTTRRPIAVLATAGMGSLVLVGFLVAVSHLIGFGRYPKPSSHAASSVTAAATTVLAPELPRVDLPSSTAVPSPATAPTTEAEAPTTISDGDTPETSLAVGHLFAGRLPEAAQAYRDLATRHPNDLAFQAASRILTRRTAPTCSATNNTRTSCPSVKQ